MESGTEQYSQLALMAISSLGIHFSYFFLIKTLVPSIAKDRRKLSWILTLITAFVVSCSGCYVLGMHVRTIFSRSIPYEEYSHTPGIGYYRHDIAYTTTTTAFQKQAAAEWSPHFTLRAFEVDGVLVQVSLAEARIAFYEAYDRTQAAKPWYRRAIFFDTRFQPADSPVGQFFTVFFAMYLVTDIVCGIRYYKERITLLAGWVHHICYLAIVYHTIFIAKEGHNFAAYLMIEIPTACIGLGFINKGFRNDMVFGALYIIFRFLFDFSLTHEYVFGRPDMCLTTKFIICSKCLLNIQFFSDWVKQQIRLRRKTSHVVVTTVPAKSQLLDAMDLPKLESSASGVSNINQQDELQSDSVQRIAVKSFGWREKGEVPGIKAAATTLFAQEARSVEFAKSTTMRRRTPSTRSKRMENKAPILTMEDSILQNSVAVR